MQFAARLEVAPFQNQIVNGPLSSLRSPDAVPFITSVDVTLGTCPTAPDTLRLACLMNKIAVLYDAGQAVLSTFDLDEVLQRILGIAHDYFHLRNVAIMLVDQQSQQLYVRSQIGWDEGQDKVLLPPGQGITGAAALKKQPVYAP